MPERSGDERAGEAADRPDLALRLSARRLRHGDRHAVYRVGFAAAGFALLVAGVAMLVLPGPGLLVCAAGLGMLSLEFHWAERLLLRLARAAESGRERIGRRRRA